MARLTVIGNDTFKDVVRKNVAPTAEIMTKSPLSFTCLANEFKAHEAVRHYINEYKSGIAYSNSV